jgi:hypothetical protein
MVVRDALPFWVVASKQFIKCFTRIVCLGAPFYLAAQEPRLTIQHSGTLPNLLTPVSSASVPSINDIVGAALSTPPVTILSPNGAFTIFGSQLAAATTYLTSTDIVNDQLPTNLGGTCVESGTTKWYLYYVSPGQINALVGELPPPGTRVRFR